MLNLILNENMKIYRRLRTWILIALLVAVTATTLILIHANTPAPQANGDWKTNIQQQIANDNKRLERTDLPSDRITQIKTEVLVDQYRLDHNKPPSDRSLWGGVLNAANIIALVTIFTVIIAADSVAGEFSGGTIKLLLIRPSSRAKILFSKYFTTLTFSVLLLLILFGSAFLISGLLEGFSDLGAPYIYASHDGIVHEVNMAGHALSTYGYQCVELIMIVTMAFMISSVFRSSSIAIAISIGIMFLGSAAARFLARYSWAKYYLFENTDLTQYLNGSPVIAGMTVTFSISVLIIYFLAFNILSWMVFNKRDVTA